MPELPEVETVVRGLRSQVRNQAIKDLEVTSKGQKTILPYSISEFREKIAGEKIHDIKRRGKYIIFQLSTKYLIVHLRMTGRFLFSTGKGEMIYPHYLQHLENHSKDPWIRLSLLLEKGQLGFSDKRRFGTWDLVDDIQKHIGLSKLGPDPILDDISLQQLREDLNREKSIYNCLLDQTIIAGLGNIYVCEALAAAHIHPARPARSIGIDEIEMLLREIRRILEKSIALQGTSFSDYQDIDGEKGRFQDFLKVYGKNQTEIEGQTLSVEKVKIGGRSAYYIPKYQVYRQ